MAAFLRAVERVAPFTVRRLQAHTVLGCQDLASNAVSEIRSSILFSRAVTTDTSGQKANQTASSKPKLKRPKNAFMHFSVEVRAKIISEHPEMKMTEISKELGRRWRSMGEADKAPFALLATKEKEAYVKATTE
mmetsp:Transcript_19067/g.36432  ORF Transcript_19067/g.36432 Transcript_19067/m.36432 type:complete len:134 (+) Transcript_19067:79-480(+)|eukprot:CAMPEP_0114255148 /NCGR_PEP_ID=MMETSP0058-20121206/17393_1 /TAXON_ID=36894 /ORGANISM="Pyramimonas parkeae, CCMP726" /LENGTH=133 /DNA_ID=CAMNT_0001369485 /DNA_START=79 /DNA_END=480 /DNA_ORIENTATION=-